MTKRPTPNPSQEGNCGVSSQDLSSIPVGEGNNPCHPVTRLKKMKIPIQSSSVHFLILLRSQNIFPVCLGHSKSKDTGYGCIGIFIFFKRVTGWHGLFPSWEGLEVGLFPRSPYSRGQVSRGQGSWNLYE